MKTFIASLLLVSIVLTFVICNMLYICGKIDDMLEIIETLPSDSSAFETEYDTLREPMETLWHIWDSSFNRIAATTGYDNINRADDAMIMLYTSYQNRDGNNFSLARLTFSDSIKRLKALESFSLQSIF